jgi:hypothetical protein
MWHLVFWDDYYFHKDEQSNSESSFRSTRQSFLTNLTGILKEKDHRIQVLEEELAKLFPDKYPSAAVRLVIKPILSDIIDHAFRVATKQTKTSSKRYTRKASHFSDLPSSPEDERSPRTSGPLNHMESFRPRKPPKWVPDSSATNCKICGNEFNSLMRRKVRERETVFFSFFFFC